MVALNESARSELERLIEEQAADAAGSPLGRSRRREVREADLAGKGRPRASLDRLPGRDGRGLHFVEGRPHQWVAEAPVCPVCGGSPGRDLCLRCNETEVVPSSYFKGEQREPNPDCPYVDPPKYAGNGGLAGGRGRKVG